VSFPQRRLPSLPRLTQVRPFATVCENLTVARKVLQNKDLGHLRPLRPLNPHCTIAPAQARRVVDNLACSAQEGRSQWQNDGRNGRGLRKPACQKALRATVYLGQTVANGRTPVKPGKIGEMCSGKSVSRAPGGPVGRPEADPVYRVPALGAHRGRRGGRGPRLVPVAGAGPGSARRPHLVPAGGPAARRPPERVLRRDVRRLHPRRNHPARAFSFFCGAAAQGPAGGR